LASVERFALKVTLVVMAITKSSNSIVPLAMEWVYFIEQIAAMVAILNVVIIIGWVVFN
jgi:hypothetical protein